MKYKTNQFFSGPALTILKSRYRDASQWLGTPDLDNIFEARRHLGSIFEAIIWIKLCFIDLVIDEI